MLNTSAEHPIPMYLDGPLSVGLFEPEPQEPRDRDRHEERLDEGGVVDELVDVVGGQHGQRDEAEDDEAGHGSAHADVDEGHGPRHVAVAGADEEDSGRGEDDPVDAAEGGAGHEERHRPRHHAHRARGEGLQIWLTMKYVYSKSVYQINHGADGTSRLILLYNHVS